MTNSKQKQYDRFKRSVEFLDQHSEEFAPGAKALEFKEELQAVLIGLDDIVNAPKPQKGDRNSEKRDALNELRGELLAVEATARAIAATDPEFSKPFTLPDRRRKEVLVETGKMFLEKAKPVKERFEEYEMGGDFLERLEGCIGDVEATENAKKPGGGKEGQNDGVEKTNGLIAEGERLVGFLDVVMGNKYRDKSEKLEAWRGASAIEVKKRKKKSAE